MSTSSASCLFPPVIRMEQMRHRVVTETLQGYFHDYGVSPVCSVRGWVRWIPLEDENHTTAESNTTMRLGTEHVVIGWSHKQALLCIHLGGHEVFVEPMNGENWDQIIFHPPTRSLLTGEKGNVLQSNGC